MNMYHAYHYVMVQNRGNASHSLCARGPESFANGLRSRFVVGVCEYMCETQKICQFGLLVSAFLAKALRFVDPSSRCARHIIASRSL